MEDLTKVASTLIEALPYMKRHNGSVMVIKFGGHAMVDDTLAYNFARDVTLLKQVGTHPIIVHGGGPQIKRLLEKLNIKSEFVDGLRVTDHATMEAVEMVLAGQINKQIVSKIQAAGGKAVGISGKDATLITAKKLKYKDKDLGFVGEPEHVDTSLLDYLINSEIIPVIAPIACDKQGQTLNINADTAAGSIAGALQARRLLMLTDVKGVLDEQGELMRWLSPHKAEELIKDKVIKGGMIPKIRHCINAIEKGTRAATILDGTVHHAVLLELFTGHGVGTQIRASDPL